jgi:hypothetical protein
MSVFQANFNPDNLGLGEPVLQCAHRKAANKSNRSVRVTQEGK